MVNVVVCGKDRVTLWPGASAVLPEGSCRVTSVCTTAFTGTSPPTDTVLSARPLTKVTDPPASTATLGGVTSLIVTVAVGAALAPGARSTTAPAAPSQPSIAAATPRRALRRIRPVAMPYLHVDTGDTSPYWEVTPLVHQR